MMLTPQHSDLINNQIILNTLMRSLLCEAICNKLDIVAFFHTHLHMELEPDTTNPILASGCCPGCMGEQHTKYATSPWCGSALERQELTFFLNTKTGQCNCILCNRDDEFLSKGNSKSTFKLILMYKIDYKIYIIGLFELPQYQFPEYDFSILCEKKRMDLCSATYYLSALLEGDLNFSNFTTAGRG